MKIERTEWANIPVNSIVYSFKTSVNHTTQLEEANVGKVQKNILLSVQPHAWKLGNRPFRLKQDGTPYKVDTCIWANCFYDNLAEAELEREKELQVFRQKLIEKQQAIQDKLDSL